MKKLFFITVHTCVFLLRLGLDTRYRRKFNNNEAEMEIICSIVFNIIFKRNVRPTWFNRLFGTLSTLSNFTSHSHNPQKGMFCLLPTATADHMYQSKFN